MLIPWPLDIPIFRTVIEMIFLLITWIGNWLASLPEYYLWFVATIFV